MGLRGERWVTSLLSQDRLPRGGVVAWRGEGRALPSGGD